MLGKKITSFVVLEQNVLVPISHRLHNARGSGELDRGTRNKEQCPKAGCQHPKAEPVHPEARSNPNHDNPEVSQLLPGVNYRQLGGVGGSLSTAFSLRWFLKASPGSPRGKDRFCRPTDVVSKGCFVELTAFRREPVGVPPEEDCLNLPLFFFPCVLGELLPAKGSAWRVGTAGLCLVKEGTTSCSHT